MMRFVWDVEKARANWAKHGVSFEDACTVFLDPLALVVPDDRHSVDERRYWIIGSSNRMKLFVVAYSEGGDTIRIISARKATRSERKSYEEA